jgi:hypothetical protein
MVRHGPYWRLTSERASIGWHDWRVTAQPLFAIMEVDGNGNDDGRAEVAAEGTAPTP